MVDDLIVLSNGWQLSSLVRTPKGYSATIEKEIASNFHPHWVTRYKVGVGVTQRDALQAAVNMRGFAWREEVEGVRSACAS